MDDFVKDKDDFISRKAAIDAIDRERKKKHLFNAAEDGLLEARRLINTLPSAQQYIRCPQHINQFTLSQIKYENTFCGEDCEIAKAYGDCFHCFESSISKRDKEIEKSAQQIVRCKDCQFFDPTDVPSTAFPNMKRCGWLKIVMTEDGYCSYGRRKELKDDSSHPFADDVMMGE